MGSYLTDVKLNGGSDVPVIGSSVPPVTTPPVTTPRPSVDPHSLAHKQMQKATRAVLGAEILDGRIPLMNPTIGMVAQATGVSASYINAARQLSPEMRREVARGLRPLVVRGAAPMTPQQRFAGAVSELGGIASALDALAVIERNGNGA